MLLNRYIVIILNEIFHRFIISETVNGFIIIIPNMCFSKYYSYSNSYKRIYPFNRLINSTSKVARNL